MHSNVNISFRVMNIESLQIVTNVSIYNKANIKVYIQHLIFLLHINKNIFDKCYHKLYVFMYIY